MALAAIAAINTVLNFTLKTLVITVATMSPFPATTRARGRTAAAAHGMAAPPPTQSGVVSGALSILDARDAGGSSRTRIPSV
jgi:hypothetical protein